MRANGTGRHAANKELIREISALKAQLGKLSAAVEARADESIESGLGAIEGKSKEAIDRAIAAAQEFVELYADQARDAAGAIADKTDELHEAAADSLIKAVRARPIGTFAAIIGLGFVAGYLCRRP